MSGHSGSYTNWPEWMTRGFWHRLPREVRRDYADGWNMNRTRDGQPINRAFRRGLDAFMRHISAQPPPNP